MPRYKGNVFGSINVKAMFLRIFYCIQSINSFSIFDNKLNMSIEKLPIYDNNLFHKIHFNRN